ncbi:MAG: hypothetical protein IH859_00770, partial [Chloroflexi bacterium]|nr:hypothetical protein [Chloroflexota bacterium]
MSDHNHDDTQPSASKGYEETRPNPMQPPLPVASPTLKRKTHAFATRIILLLILALTILMTISGLLGWSQGNFERNRTVDTQTKEYLLEQYTLAEQDFAEGRFDLARQRYEYMFAQESTFLDVADRWLEVMVILSGTATPIPKTIEITPTATFDPRPAEELFALAQSLIAVQDWNQAIAVLSALRSEDSAYNFVEVDRMLYLALRNRGIAKISVEGNLEGGLYDFALAEGFGPIDAAAANLRELARLYLIGNSFWVAYPDIAAFYYGQVATVAPNLRDSSGISAFYRYWASLVQYADQLALEEDWCAASEQYQIAYNARNDANIVPTSQYVTELCFQLTPSVTPSMTTTTTVTITTTPDATLSPTTTEIPE